MHTENTITEFETSRRHIAAIVWVLLGLGLVMTFSASCQKGTGFINLIRHMIWMLIGMLGFLLASRINHKVFKKLYIPILVAAFVLLALTLIPQIGKKVHGARRWLRIGDWGFQPSEFAKFAFIIFFAAYFSQKKDVSKNFVKGFIVPLAILGFGLGLIIIEPDIGTSFLIATVIFLIMLAAGTRILHIFIVTIVTAPLLLFTFWHKFPYFARRLGQFFSGELPYQQQQALIAIGSGGLFGKGLGKGTAKLQFLPEAHTDFIYAIIGEELGFIGTIGVILLFIALIYQMMKIMQRSRDLYTSLVCVGIIMFIALQCLINLAVVTAVMPAKGIPLPFVSAGGSSLLFCMVSLGIFFNISRHVERDVKMQLIEKEYE